MFGCLGTMRKKMWVCHGFCLCEMRGGLKIGVGLKWVIYPVGYSGRGKPTASSLSAGGFPSWPVQISNHWMAIRL